MRINSIFSMVILAGWWAVSPTQVWAGLVFGPSARTQFESYRTSVGDTFIDFNNLALNTNLTSQLSGLGVTFASNINVDGTPFGPFHVQVSAAPGRANTIVGSPCDGGCTDDGRVGYQILFSSPQRRAGLLRNWNTQTLTQFYNASGSLLAQHTNTVVGSEFVGFIADGANPATNWVARIQIDTVAPANARQVGYSDDLFFGTAPDTTPYTLSVAKSGTGSGTVTSSLAGINCGAACSGSFPSGTSVTLTATAAAGSTFAGWSGACTGTGVCTVTMDAAKNLTAVFNIVPFVATTSTNITATSATITSRITFNTPDVGKPGAVYVTAWVPVGALGTLGISATLNSQLSVTGTRDNPNLAGAANSLHLTYGPLAEMDASAFVLVQLTSSGWQLVTNGQLVPYASGVLGDQLAAQTILNNASTANLAGAQFCLGYGTSAAEMTAAGRIQLVETIPDPNAASAATGSCIVSNPAAGIWWNPAEGGRGFVIEQRGNTLFLGVFLYDSSGRASWYAASGAMSGNTFSGALSTYASGQTLTGPYVAPTVTGSAGNISITFTDTSHGTLTWPGGTIPIQRFDVVTGGAAMTPAAGTPETGIWWNPAESGRGFALEIQAGTMFLGGYMFDAGGNPIWYSSGQTPMTDAMTYIGTWNQYGNGQTMTGTYKPATVVNPSVGTVRIDFSDTENATLTLPDGRRIPITRFRF